MKFRPCIDIHNGKVKQIVGGSLKDQGNQANENFVSEQDASYYAQLYEEKGITGGHVILLNKKDSEYYPETKRHPSHLKARPCTFTTGASIPVKISSTISRKRPGQQLLWKTLIPMNKCISKSQMENPTISLFQVII